MCLAVPGQIIFTDHENMTATVDLAGNRLNICIMLLPDVKDGDWVLIHTGFAIQYIDEKEAREQIKLLEQLCNEYD